MWFADTDAYKWIEAASYVLTSVDDPDLEQRVDKVVDLVAAAQQYDGYLNTYFTLEALDKRWANLDMLHELYCAGHLIEAAVAHHRATGKSSPLDVAVDFADHRPDLLDGVVTVSGEATVPSRDGWGGELYRSATETTTESAPFTAVPYYAWDNRETGPMRVWIRDT